MINHIPEDDLCNILNEMILLNQTSARNKIAIRNVIKNVNQISLFLIILVDV